VNITTTNVTTLTICPELLQKPTYFESEKNKSKLLTDVEVHNFIRSQQQANTVKKQCMT